MNRRAQRLLIVMLLCGGGPGCAAGADSLSMSFSVPFLAEQGTSCNLDNFRGANTLSATVSISGGYDDCGPLTVNSDDLTVTGSCADIAIGAVRSLALEYSLTSSSGTQVALEATLAHLDLRPNTLRGAADVTLDLSDPEPPRAIRISRPQQVAALPTSDAACDAVDADTPDRYLCDAERWWIWFRTVTPPDFDRDDDGLSNLFEACNGTLF